MERFNTVVIGGGQAGLAVGYYLARLDRDFADQLDPAITQLHSAEYRNPAQLSDSAVLIVGAGNSGAEIALELAKTRHTWLAGAIQVTFLSPSDASAIGC